MTLIQDETFAHLLDGFFGDKEGYTSTKKKSNNINIYIYTILSPFQSGTQFGKGCTITKYTKAFHL